MKKAATGIKGGINLNVLVSVKIALGAAYKSTEEKETDEDGEDTESRIDVYIFTAGIEYKFSAVKKFLLYSEYQISSETIEYSYNKDKDKVSGWL